MYTDTDTIPVTRVSNYQYITVATAMTDTVKRSGPDIDQDIDP